MNQLLAILNKNFGELDGETLTKVYSVSQTSPGFIEGQLPNNLGYGFLMYTPDNKVAIACYIDSSGQPILKIAKDGYDALTATDAQLIFNSAQNVFKIVMTSSVSIPANLGGTTTTTVAHNLGYVPAFQCYLFVTGSATYYQIPYTSIDAVTGAVNILATAYADATNIYFETIVTAVGTQPWTIKYYLLQESAA
jgi:hypothetical protein